MTPEHHLRLVLEDLVPVDDWADKSLDLEDTPRRIAKMMKEELLAGYKPGALDALKAHFTCFPSDGRDAMVLETGIEFTSLCGHHGLPFTGTAHVAYIPGPFLIGASKIPRVLEHYSKMLQIQERLTRQVADFLFEHAEAMTVIVLLEAQHACMACRGVKQPSVKMVTTAIRPQPSAGKDLGDLRGVLDEFYAQIQFMRK